MASWCRFTTVTTFRPTSTSNMRGTRQRSSLALIEGELPARAKGLVIEWATLHRDELREAFNKAANLQKPGSIPPLP